MMINLKKQGIAQNRRAYDCIAGDFFIKKQREWEGWKQSWKYLTKYAKKGDKVLDVGCGFGRLYHLLEDLQVNYVGIDQSEEQIKLARREFPSQEFMIAEMTKLPFKNGEFDIIYCLAVFHHLLDKETQLAALREMKKTLKPEGLVVIANWNLFGADRQEKIKDGDYESMGENNFMVPWKNTAGKIIGERYYHAFTLVELKDLFQLSGFEVEDNYYTKKGERSDVEEGENIVTVAQS